MFSFSIDGDGAIYNEQGMPITKEELIILYEESGMKVKQVYEPREIYYRADTGYEKRKEECNVLIFESP